MEEINENAEEIIAEEDPQSSAALLFFQFVSDTLTQYGWFLLLGSIAAYFIWVKYLQAEWKRWKDKYDERAESARYHKDPDLALARLQAMENARRKMQDQYNAAASLHAEKMKEKEETKRQEKIEDWERHQKGLGYHSKTRVHELDEVTKGKGPKSKSNLRNNDYQPLAGSSSGSFRPPKRSGCGGGGCG